MPRRKDISNDLREATVAAHQCSKGHEAIPKKDYSQLENIRDSFTFPKRGCPNKFTEIVKNPWSYISRPVLAS